MKDIPASLWIAFAITIAAIAVTQVLFGKLEARHPVTFTKLGSPHLFANNTPTNSWLFLRWVISAEALLLDSSITTWVWMYRVLAGTILVMFFSHLFKFF